MSKIKFCETTSLTVDKSDLASILIVLNTHTHTHTHLHAHT